MKINGKKVTNEGHRVGPYPIVRNIKEEVDVMEDGKPTGEKETIVVQHVYQIFAEPVWDFKKFNKLFPVPKPPIGGWAPTKDGGGKKAANPKDPQHLQDLKEWELAREGWSLMTSLAPSNIELDGVDMDDPRTWSSIKAKLQAPDGLFSFYEYNKIIGLIDEACGIDEEKIAENRETFLSEQQALATGPTSP